MPYHISGTDASGFDVINDDTAQKKNKTPYKTRAEAQKYLDTLNAAEGLGKTKTLPKKVNKAPAPEPMSAGMPPMTASPSGLPAAPGGMPAGLPPIPPGLMGRLQGR